MSQHVEINGNCHQDSQNCWFKHSDTKNNKYANKTTNEDMSDAENSSKEKIMQKFVEMVKKIF